MLKSLIGELIRGKLRAYISRGLSRYACAALAYHVSKAMKIPIYASDYYRSILKEYWKPCSNTINKAVFVECKPAKDSEPVLVINVPGTKLRKFSLARVIAREISPNTFVLVYIDYNIVYRSYFIVEITTPPTIKELGNVCPQTLLEELKELGSLITLQDAVSFLSKRLNVSKSEARELLFTLARKYCVLIDENKQVKILA